jgi:hypothetical protein
VPLPWREDISPPARLLVPLPWWGDPSPAVRSLVPLPWRGGISPAVRLPVLLPRRGGTLPATVNATLVAHHSAPSTPAWPHAALASRRSAYKKATVDAALLWPCAALRMQ